MKVHSGRTLGFVGDAEVTYAGFVNGGEVMVSGRTLGFVGDAEVKCAGVVSGGEVMTMMVRIQGGQEARMEAAFIVLQNKSRS